MIRSLGSVFASAVAGSLLLGASAVAFAGNWEVDSGHSRVGFAVRHMMIATVHGTFGKYTGTVALDDGDVTKSKVHLDIDVGSIATQNDKRDSDLKSPLFFDVARFPTITFDSTKVEKRGAHGLSVAGNLTIKGVTKPVVLTVADLSGDVKDPFGAIRRGATATAKINRKDFGLTWNKPLETGGVVLGDEVALELDVELKKAR
jgi:polyisoprenoid-binding protein YceI